MTDTQVPPPSSGLNGSSSTVVTATGTESVDPASSLRAAALLTLKSNKRRKPTKDHNSSLARRPPTDEIFLQLDYGQEQDSAQTSHQPTHPQAEVQPQPQPQPPEADPGQIREEGEISDTEGTVPAPVKRKSSLYQEAEHPPGPDVAKYTTTMVQSPKSTSPVKLEVEPRLFRDNLNDSMQPNPISTADSPRDVLMHNASYVCDENHVRPGLLSLYWSACGASACLPFFCLQ